MNHDPLLRKTLAGLVVLASITAAGMAHSQTLGEPAMIDIQGASLAGAPFKLERLRGKVVMVLHWSSDCPVCLDKMRELRLNTEGWAGRPFEVVLINTDRSMETIREYQRIVGVILPPHLKFTQLWQKSPDFKQVPWVEAGRQPVTWIVDKQGKLLGKYHGRLPLDVWDQIADLL
ncbi:MAG: hypothetical protein RLZZ271_113 [Pseudomonadota bacterium]|jgi:peroxiredoxin